MYRNNFKKIFKNLLIDEKKLPIECPEGEFNCDVTRCISDDKRCDGTKDCQDEADESNCPALETSTTEPGE